MKPAGIVGIVLIAIGIIALAYGGFSYTKREKVIDAGPLQVSATARKPFPFLQSLAASALWVASFCSRWEQKELNGACA